MTPGKPDSEFVTYEDDEARNRSSYTYKLVLLALLPYVYVFTTLAVIFALFGLVLWTIISGQGRDGAILWIEIAGAVMAASFLRSMWVRVLPPKGLSMPGTQATSALLKTTREIARMIRGPKVHAILWTEEFDLSIAAVPRLSSLGGPLRYYLTVGLPLMHALSPEQFRARLAHELGLSAAAHGRFRSWLNRSRLTWLPVLSALTSRGPGKSWLFSRFFAWYMKFFQVYARVANRYHVYEADRSASDVTSAEVMAEALLRINYAAYLDDAFWNEDSEEADKESDSYTYLADLLKRSLTDSEQKEWVDRTLRERTNGYQLRPSLSDRLAALGQTVHVPAPIAQSAAEAFLAGDLPEVTERLDQGRKERIGADWPQQDNKAPTEYESGTQLLREDREEGVALLERAMALEPNLTAPACAQLSTYYQRQNDVITANRYSRRSLNHWQLFEKAVAERTQVSLIETFRPHELSEFEVELLRKELAKHGDIKEAYLVRKEVTYLQEKPLHALGLVLDRGWLKQTPEDISFAKRLPPATKRPPEFYTFVLDYKNRRLGNIIRNVSNSLVYKIQPKNDETK